MNLSYAPNNTTLSEPTAFTKLACNIWDCITDDAKREWFINGISKFVDCIAKVTAYIPSKAEQANVYEYIIIC